MEIYTECDESFLVGFYLSSFDEYSLFHLLDEQGKIDGIYLIKNKFIKNTNYETEYLEKINLYAEFWKINSDKNIFNICFIDRFYISRYYIFFLVYFKT